MRTCLRKLVNVAEGKESELSIALQNIERHLVFCGFGGETPHVSMCAGCEIILEYQGSELDIEKVIELMEEVGYITKDDFIL
ncbi:hypothetical protein [Prevotella intermedia]|uniref:Uncharacterized protein n=1 Tax=Prevotella intermedia TaxID=28131 RepID=A0A2G8I8F7_PREIN|nr:hypothetical protein [Prevotella intermedia]PIK19778.1 hypothetical protein CTI18_13000 [Prevotella intermedia]